MGLYTTPNALAAVSGKDASALGKSKGPKVAKLVFTMGIGEHKVATALSAVSGVKVAVIDAFNDMLLAGIGGKMFKDEVLTLEWDGNDRVSVQIRGKAAGSMKDKALAQGLLDMYLGKGGVSRTLKEDIDARLKPSSK